jgi:hypothetical protein
MAVDALRETLSTVNAPQEILSTIDALKKVLSVEPPRGDTKRSVGDGVLECLIISLSQPSTRVHAMEMLKLVAAPACTSLSDRMEFSAQWRFSCTIRQKS